jgi:hypothetical protein
LHVDGEDGAGQRRAHIRLLEICGGPGELGSGGIDVPGGHEHVGLRVDLAPVAGQGGASALDLATSLVASRAPQIEALLGREAPLAQDVDTLELAFRVLGRRFRARRVSPGPRRGSPARRP